MRLIGKTITGSLTGISQDASRTALKLGSRDADFEAVEANPGADLSPCPRSAGGGMEDRIDVASSGMPCPRHRQVLPTGCHRSPATAGRPTGAVFRAAPSRASLDMGLEK
jgi:hypothetical protein